MQKKVKPTLEDLKRLEKREKLFQEPPNLNPKNIDIEKNHLPIIKNGKMNVLTLVTGSGLRLDLETKNYHEDTSVNRRGSVSSLHETPVTYAICTEVDRFSEPKEIDYDSIKQSFFRIMSHEIMDKIVAFQDLMCKARIDGIITDEEYLDLIYATEDLEKGEKRSSYGHDYNKIAKELIEHIQNNTIFSDKY